mgnify:CR=1 FL=1
MTLRTRLSQAKGACEPVRLVLAVLIRLGLILGLLLVTAQDVSRYRLYSRGRESGTAQEQPALEAPRLGIGIALDQYETNLDLLDALRTVREMGYGAVVQRINWATIEPVRGEFEWRFWDEALRLVHEQGLRVIAILEGAPEWSRATHEADNPDAPPQDPGDYARFAAALASRYGDLLYAYQIWDAPNIYPHWGKGAIDPAGYVALLESAAEAIRAVDDDALIVAGGMAPNTESAGRNMSDVRFLKEIYRLGAAEWFDVVGVKAYGFWSGPYDRRVADDVLNLSRAVLLREEMRRHGDAGKPLWALEGGWVALPEGWRGAPSPLGTDSATLQAQRLRDAYGRVQREWPWMTLFCALHLQPAAAEEDPIWGLALLDAEGEPTALMRDLGMGLGADGVYSTGRHQVSPQLSLAGVPASQEHTLEITFYGTELAIEVEPSGDEGTIQVIAPQARTIALGIGGRKVQRYWLVRGEQPGEHTVSLVGSAADLAAIRSVYSGMQPAALCLVGRLVAALALAAWLAAGVQQRLACIDWRKPYRWARTRANSKDALPIFALAVVFGLSMSVSATYLRLALLALYGAGALLRPDAALLVAVATVPIAPVHVPLPYGSFSVTELAILCAALARAGASVLGGEPLRTARRAALGWTDLFFAGFVLWSFIGAFSAEYQREALREFRTALAEPAVLYVLLRLIGNDVDLWERLTRAFFFSAVGTAVYALVLYPLPQGVIEAEGVRRARAFYGSPNNLALFLERLLPLGVARFAALRQGKRRWAWLGGTLLISLAVGLTYSRGAWLLGIPAGLLCLALLQGKRPRRYALAVPLLLLLALIPLSQTERLASLWQLQEGTTFLRLQLWRSSWEMVRDHLWTGVGLDNFLYYYGDYIRPGAEIERWLSHPHNIILDLWLRTGLPGLLLYAGTMISAILPTVRRWSQMCAEARWVPAGLLGGVAAMLAHCLIDNALFAPELAYYAAFALAAIGMGGSRLTGNPGSVD